MIITAAEIKVGMKVTSVNNGNSCKVSKIDKTSSGIGIYKKSKGVDVLVWRSGKLVEYVVAN